MSKTLSTILAVFKVFRIIAKVVFILCIIGAVGCALGLVGLPFVNILSFSDKMSAYSGCIIGLIACVGEAVFAFLAKRYFANVLTDGTPFTFGGAKECFRLGVASIIISVAISLISAITIFVFMLIQLYGKDVDVDFSISITTGLFFIFMSVIFKHGAELEQASNETAAPQESTSISQTDITVE